MFKTATPLFLEVLTPLHAGSGQDLGVVDLPIQRERHTDFPKIEASSLKGSIRETFEELSDTKKGEIIEGYAEDFDIALHLAFGYDDAGVSDNIKTKFKDNSEFAGALGFTDARILLFPVKSMKGVFAYTTCPSVLKKFKEEMVMCELKCAFNIPKVEIGKAIVSNKGNVAIKDNIILEEYSFTITEDKSIAEQIITITGIDEIKDKLVIFSFLIDFSLIYCSPIDQLSCDLFLMTNERF